jgi:hypothetical protein
VFPRGTRLGFIGSFVGLGLSSRSRRSRCVVRS